MNKTLKHIKQFKAAKAAIELIHREASIITEYEDFQNYLNTLASYFNNVANDTTAPNKNIVALQNFYRDNVKKKREVKTISNKATSKRLNAKISFHDYLSEYRILRDRGYSYRSIAQYSEKYFKVKVSKDTIKKYLAEV